MNKYRYVIPLNEVTMSDIHLVGGKNASTGEMIRHLTRAGVNVPGGFAVTTTAYDEFLSKAGLDIKIKKILARTSIKQVKQLQTASKTIQQLILKASFLPGFAEEIKDMLTQIGADSVAVRSSATAEDLPEASFAGQQESFLHVRGLKHVLDAIKRVYASLYTSRAIAYRAHHHIDFHRISLSVGIQPMIRSDLATSGVMFTLDTESGFDKVILITSVYGLGETIVQGKVNPDEFFVHKPTLEKNKLAILQRKLGTKSLKSIYTNNARIGSTIKLVKVPAKQSSRFSITDKEIEQLARYAMLIEKHYQLPMDIEWAKDGLDGKLYILQARPETVQSQVKRVKTIDRYTIAKSQKVLVTGQAVGQGVQHGKAKIIASPKQMNSLRDGEILVTEMTDPDWEPVMKRASAIVTNRGGRTCHAAIVARELGIPAVVGCDSATTAIKNNMTVTVSCAEGQVGSVYDGKVAYQKKTVHIDKLPNIPLNIYLNLGNPYRAFATQFIPNKGVGLARIEFIINDMIGIHPSAVLKYHKLPTLLKKEITAKTAAYPNPVEFYIEKLREGIAMIAAAFYPKPVIFRFSDFKSNEYANLLGGKLFEPDEENPMLGFRGAARYQHERFRDCFELECKAINRVRNKMGLTNAHIMVPFVRTVSEFKGIISLLAKYGLKRQKDFKFYMMCEIPSNIVLAKDFLPYVDGYSIGSNDLTQLMLGLDRDSSIVAPLFDERNEAVKIMLHQVINECKRQKKEIGICGQAPSDYPDFATWLMKEGINSISLNPDCVVETWVRLGK